MTRLPPCRLRFRAALLIAALFVAGVPARGQEAACNDYQDCHVLLTKILTVLKSSVQPGSTPDAGAIEAWYQLKQLYRGLLDSLPPDLKNSLIDDQQRIDAVFRSQSASILRAKRDLADRQLLEQGKEVGKQITPESPNRDAELAGLYTYYMTLQFCAERFPLVFREPLAEFRDVLTNREKDLAKEHTDAVWNATAERFRLAETRLRVEGDGDAIRDCEQVRGKIDTLLALVPDAEEVPLRRKDF